VLAIGIFALLVIAYGLVSGRLEGTSVTAPMVFVTVGLLVGWSGTFDFGAVVTARPSEAGQGIMRLTGRGLLTTAEVALALLLFTDAARLQVRKVRGNAELPARLLLLGLPLSITIGGAFAALLFRDHLIVWEAFVLATIIAPTDAALGEAVVTSRGLPVRIRQALNIESGLNDGLAVPLFTIFVALAVADEEVTATSAVRVIIEKVGGGLAIGIAVGIIGGKLVQLSQQRGWITGLFEQLTVAALGVFGWWLAEELGGSGFIAAFVAGLLAGRIFRRIGATVVDFTEDVGQLLNLFIFFVFGVISYELLGLVTWREVVFAVFALTVMRMLPVAIALMGTRLGRPTVWFVGWFGPRGLASVILAYIAVADEPELSGITTVVVATSMTVLISVYAHGLSAAPLVQRYSRWCGSMDADSPEMTDVSELPTRTGHVTSTSSN
jgi:NhaP-type Na+/H+ or K+/H+ antiporter